MKNAERGKMFPEWLVHIGNWASTIAAGGLTLLGVLIGLRGVSRQVRAGYRQQLAEFRDRDRRAKEDEWKETQAAAAALHAELQLQYQLIFQRNISEEIDIFCKSLEKESGPVRIPQGYDIYSPERIFPKMEPYIQSLPSWLVTFVVRYMGLLHYELNRFVTTIEYAKDKRAQVHQWDIASIQMFRRITKSFDILKERCDAIMAMLILIQSSSSENVFLKKISDEKERLDKEFEN